MFFFLPWGHDRPMYDRPWATYALMAACLLVHLLGLAGSMRAEREIEAAAIEIGEAIEDDPEGRISFTVNGLPSQIDAIIQPLVDTSAGSAGDPRLEGGVRRLVDGLNAMPAVRYGWRPGAPSLPRALTYMFVHADVFHLLGNLLILWIAGGLIECFWNRWAFVGLYFASGFGGLLAQHVSAPTSLLPIVGASGAIAGLLGALVAGYPSARIKIFYFFLLVIRPVWGTWLAPAWFVIPLWASLQLFDAVVSGGEDGVAYWAHVGGFACGVVLALLARRMNLIALDAGRDIAHDHVPVTVEPGASRRSIRPSERPPAREPGPRRPSSPPPPLEASVRLSERPPGPMPGAQPPARARSQRPPPGISLEELPPARGGEEIER